MTLKKGHLRFTVSNSLPTGFLRYYVLGPLFSTPVLLTSGCSLLVDTSWFGLIPPNSANGSLLLQIPLAQANQLFMQAIYLDPSNIFNSLTSNAISFH